MDAKLAYGAMLYRAGYDPMADVVAYCGLYNIGYVDNFMLGHLWTELGDDLIDFSCGDWHREAEWQVQVAPDGLPPITWQVEPPQYLWQKAAPLKQAWRKIGQPALGEYRTVRGRAWCQTLALASRLGLKLRALAQVLLPPSLFFCCPWLRDQRVDARQHVGDRAGSSALMSSCSAWARNSLFQCEELAPRQGMSVRLCCVAGRLARCRLSHSMPSPVHQFLLYVVALFRCDGIR